MRSPDAGPFRIAERPASIRSPPLVANAVEPSSSVTRRAALSTASTEASTVVTSGKAGSAILCENREARLSRTVGRKDVPEFL